MSRDRLLAAWAGLGAVDHHCHPLRRPVARITAAELRAAFSEARDPRQIAEHVPHTAVYRDAVRRIAAALGCAPAEAVVLETRAQRPAVAHLDRLMAWSGTATMLLDHGYAVPGAMDSAEHRGTVGVAQHDVVRLETLAESLLEEAEAVDAERMVLAGNATALYRLGG